MTSIASHAASGILYSVEWAPDEAVTVTTRIESTRKLLRAVQLPGASRDVIGAAIGGGATIQVDSAAIIADLDEQLTKANGTVAAQVEELEQLRKATAEMALDDAAGRALAVVAANPVQPAAADVVPIAVAKTARRKAPAKK